jgi:hypothetical protein
MKGKVGIKLFLKRLQIFTTETLEVQQAFLQILKVQIYSEISFSKHVFKGFITFIYSRMMKMKSHELRPG